MKLQWIAYLGIPLIQFSTCFQIAKIYRTKSVDGVSIVFWWMVLAGLICYEVFAIANMIWPYIISNALGLWLTIWYLILYYHYKRDSEEDLEGWGI